MKKNEKTGYVIALVGAIVTGLFVLLSGLRQFDFLGSWLVGTMVFGLLLSLLGFYLAARAEES